MLLIFHSFWGEIQKIHKFWRIIRCYWGRYWLYLWRFAFRQLLFSIDLSFHIHSTMQHRRQEHRTRTYQGSILLHPWKMSRYFLSLGLSCVRWRCWMLFRKVPDEPHECDESKSEKEKTVDLEPVNEWMLYLNWTSSYSTFEHFSAGIFASSVFWIALHLSLNFELNILIKYN